ncbi:MAG TPA: UvrD-helicase domain-containing protein, partial [Arthrobacter sp.]|nr:UvrD-helicase domain-containing protein [Arthrobacter sp.]
MLVYGAPGTGKSTVLVEHAVRRVEQTGLDPARILMLAPSRLAAARLRDKLTARLNRSLSATPARTWAAYAFDLIRRARAEGRLPLLERAPRLMSGPEQDQIIAELLQGHRAGHSGAVRWPRELDEALATRGFRHEIRQLFDRVIEYGSTAEQLEAMGAASGREDWQSAARLFREYRDLIDLRMPEAFDPAGIITAARQLLMDDEDFLYRERQRLGLILVDDLQEANPAVYELLAVLAEGKDAIVTASPDTVVQGFRGARPDLLARLSELLAGGGGTFRTMALTGSHRMGPTVAAAWQRVASRTSLVAGAQKARELTFP